MRKKLTGKTELAEWKNNRMWVDRNIYVQNKIIIIISRYGYKSEQCE